MSVFLFHLKFEVEFWLDERGYSLQWPRYLHRDSKYNTTSSLFQQATIGALTNEGDDHKVQLHHLCAQCRTIFTSSRLIHGSRLPIVPTEESFVLHASVGGLQDALAEGCHFCTMIASSFKCKAKKTILEVPEPVLEIKLSKSLNGTYTMVLLNSELYYFGCNIRRWKTHPPWSKASTQVSTSSTYHMDLCNNWLKTCLSDHNHSLSAFSPTRLLNVGLSGSKEINLQTSLLENAQYCTLSHCWGASQDILMLRQDNLDRLSNGIQISALPKTFQDAVHITRTLGQRFLWIDSLCIIQDSQDDWLQESATMGLIYESSICTISAAASTNFHGGCFIIRDPLSVYPCRVAGSINSGTYMEIDKEYREKSLETSPIFSRGWIFQELILSPRILFFGPCGIHWLCSRDCKHEIPRDPDDDDLSEASGSLSFTTLLTMPASAIDVHVLNRHWFQIVTKYSELDLTIPTDRLLALSGLAERIQQRVGLSYIAGLWKESLVMDLLWLGVDRPYERPSIYVAPSWSWASRARKVSLLFGSADFFYFRRSSVKSDLVKIDSVEVFTSPLDASCTGQVSGGSLKVVGYLKKIGIKAVDVMNATEQSPEPWSFSFSLKRINRPQIHFDTPLPYIEGLYLMPAQKITKHGFLKVRHGYSSRQKRKIIDKITKGRIDTAYLGLVLQANGAYYERVGCFGLFSLERPNEKAEWFNDCAEETIEIR